jgi:single-stranded-DNA-specific exonuclease
LGRIDDPQKGVQLLLIRNVLMAEKMALELDLNNIERQKIERMMSSEAENMLLNQPDLLKHKAIILESPAWHPGIIAILSARISRHYNKPVIIIAVQNGIGKGSLRSIHEFPLLPHLKECSDILLNFGGHDFAAGLTIQEEHIAEFKRRFLAIADRALSDSDVLSKLCLDSEVHFNDLTFDFMESMRLLEPFGNGNYPPVLYCQAKQAWPPKVVGKTHLKFYLLEHFNAEQRNGEQMFEGIAPGRASASTSLRKRNLSLEVAFTPQINNFQGPSIQLMIRDFKPHLERNESP